MQPPAGESPRPSAHSSVGSLHASGSPRDSPRDEHLSKAEKQARQLEKVADELLNSERTYLKDVELLIQIYLEPLRRDPKSPRAPAAGEEDVSDLLSGADVNGIFSNIEQVLGVNRVLLEALEKDHSIGNLAAAFSKMAEYLKVYSIYCSNQDAALRLVEEHEKKQPKFAKFLKASQKKFLSRGLDLRDFLIKPTQRICKYPLFLRELIGNTPSDSPFQKTLLDVEAKIEAVVSHINEQRRLKQGLEGVAELHRKLATEYPLVTSQRVMVFKGAHPLREVSSFGSSLSVSSASKSLHNSTGSDLSASGDDVLRGNKGSLLGGFKRMSRRGSATGASSQNLSPRTMGPSVSSPRLSSPRVSRHSGGRLSSSTMSMEDVLKEAQIFIFNDLILYCRPCKALGRKGMLEVFMEMSPEKVRARRWPDVQDGFLLRLLKDGGPDIPTKFVFQCRDSLDLDAWIEAFEKINPFTPISERRRMRDPSTLAISLELESLSSRYPLIEKQLILLRERLQVLQLKTQKLISSEDESTDQVLRKLLNLAYSLPQWKFQAKEVKRLTETAVDWLRKMAPHAKYSRVIERGDSGLDKTYVSLRAHQKRLEAEKEKNAALHMPPALPPRDPADYEDEWDEVEEEEEYEDDDDFDVDKLSDVLREKSADMSPLELEKLKETLKGVMAADASRGPSGKKKKKRWVKVKKRKKVVPPAMRAMRNSDRKSQSLPSSPVSGRKKAPGRPPPAAPQRAVPAPPAIPDYAHEDLRGEVKEATTRFEEALSTSTELWTGYKTLEREILLKTEALQQLADALSQASK